MNNPEEVLYASRRSRVIRVRRPGGPLIRKILNAQPPSVEDLARFRREHAVTSALAEIPGVIRCHGLVRHEEALALELEDIGGLSLDRMPTAALLGMVAFLDLAIRLAAVLGGVHATGVVHRDITPANIIRNPRSGEVRLIDFGLADHLHEEMVEPCPLSLLEGTLAYLAPEQSGRMNRPVDARSDLYALGATFYALLTGQPPFVSRDPVTLLADHLAHLPVPPHRLRPEVPEMIARIVLKLLAKEPAERYQSARGLEADLDQCRSALAASGEMTPFPLGQRERLTRLRFSSRLHGRDKEVKLLRDALREGRGLVLVEGSPGVGKSALAGELRGPTSAARGRFATGKFDQLRRERPLAALMEAMAELLRYRLADPPEIFEPWRIRVAEMLGDALPVLVGHLPELASVFPDPPVPVDLPPARAASRFRRGVIRLMQSLGQAGTPMVLLLDDLQWSDPAFLEVMRELLTDAGMERLLVVGVYRGNETPPSHPLALAIADWREQGIVLSHLALRPLSRRATLAFLAETLGCPLADAAPLAALLHDKSGGNPFLLRTLLLEIKGNDWLSHGDGRWRWNEPAIREWRMPEKVVTLLMARMERLPNVTRELLATAACLGHAFDLAVLAAAAGHPSAAVALEADRLLKTGLWLPARGEHRLAVWLEDPGGSVRYRFAHDRVQEAAMAALTPDLEVSFRLRLGRRLMAAFAHDREGDRLFLVAEQFTRIPPERLDEDERAPVAGWLLAAGRQAKGAAAFAPALRLLESAMALSGEAGWRRDFAKALALRHLAAECAAALMDLDRLEGLRTEVNAHCPDFKDHLPILSHLPFLYVGRGAMEPLRAMGIDILRRIGHPMRLTSGAVARQVNRLRKEMMAAFGQRTGQELACLPMTGNAEFAFLSRWLFPMFIGIYFSAPSLTLHFVVGIASRMLREGMVAEAAWYYIWLSINFTGCDQEEEMACGIQLGEASRLLLERGIGMEIPGVPARHMYNVFVRPWREPLAEATRHIFDQYPEAIAKGDHAYAGWSICAGLVYRLQLGMPLEEGLRLGEHWLPLLAQSGQAQLSRLMNRVYPGMLRELRDKGDASWRELSDLPPEIAGDPENMPIFLIQAGIVATLFREYERVVMMMQMAREVQKRSAGGHRPSASFLLAHESLALLALSPGEEPTRRRRMMGVVRRNHRQLAIWARHNPANFAHLALLVRATWHRVAGHPEQAVPLCEEIVAMIRAQEHEVWLPYEALALELAGEALLEMGCASQAGHALRRAMRAWMRQGALAPMRLLEERHASLVAGWDRPVEADDPVAAPDRTSDRVSLEELIDYPSLLRASQAIASEQSHAGVAGRLLSLALANAGAESGRLYLPLGPEWFQACAARYRSQEVVLLDHAEHGGNGKERRLALVRYVARRQEALVIDDVRADALWADLPGAPRSILCAPLRHLGAIMGVLLLEHDNVTGVFSRERVEVVAILGAQAAIALLHAQALRTEQRMTERIRHLSGHLDQATEAERKRLAAEIHDELGSHLTAIRFGLAELEAGLDTRRAATCHQLGDLAGETLQTMRRIAVSLRPPVLDRLGIRAVLEWLARETGKHYGFVCRVTDRSHDGELDEARRTALFRICQEALTNVARHARAGSVSIDLLCAEGMWTLTVSDDGQGFALEIRGDPSRCFGLGGMEERAVRLGGTLVIDSRPGLGTRVIARLPAT
ncbi:MAG: AAA family ATPase [Magnetococcales bacterium]|nr:AAA family ATPase [Magnetococcales bacterium]